MELIVWSRLAPGGSWLRTGPTPTWLASRERSGMERTIRRSSSRPSSPSERRGKTSSRTSSSRSSTARSQEPRSLRPGSRNTSSGSLDNTFEDMSLKKMRAPSPKRRTPRADAKRGQLEPSTGGHAVVDGPDKVEHEDDEIILEGSDEVITVSTATSRGSISNPGSFNRKEKEERTYLSLPPSTVLGPRAHEPAAVADEPAAGLTPAEVPRDAPGLDVLSLRAEL